MARTDRMQRLFGEEPSLPTVKRNPKPATTPVYFADGTPWYGDGRPSDIAAEKRMARQTRVQVVLGVFFMLAVGAYLFSPLVIISLRKAGVLQQQKQLQNQHQR